MSSNPPSTVCPKCSGSMEFGLLIDAGGGASVGNRWSHPERVQEWVRGTPGRSWWHLGFKADAGDRLQVATLRCTQCGFLELYAPEGTPE